MSFATPRLMRWTSARTASVSGFLITGLGCLMSIHLNPDAAYNVTVPSLIVRGIGQLLVVVALGVMAIQGLEKDQVGSASRLFSMVRNIGGAIGIGLSSQTWLSVKNCMRSALANRLPLLLRQRRKGWSRQSTGSHTFISITLPLCMAQGRQDCASRLWG